MYSSRVYFDVKIRDPAPLFRFQTWRNGLLFQDWKDGEMKSNWTQVNYLKII